MLGITIWIVIAYQIFFKNNIPPNVQDKELRKYIDNLAG